MTRPYKYDRPYQSWHTTICVKCRGYATQRSDLPSNGSICNECRKKDFPNGTTTSTEDTTTLMVTTESSEQQWQEQ
jgi:hypothetical protein